MTEPKYPEYEVTWALERLIYKLVTDKDPEAVEERLSMPGMDPAFGTRRFPLALPALTAARRVLAEALMAEEEAIRHARGKGHTWKEIVDALFADLETGRNRFVEEAKRHDMTVRVAGWRYAMYRVWPADDEPHIGLGGAKGLYWRCWTCSQPITEQHPEYGKEAQEGHLPNCARGRKWA